MTDSSLEEGGALLIGWSLTSLLVLALVLGESSLGPRGDAATSFLSLLASLPLVVYGLRRVSWSVPRDALLGLSALVAYGVWFFGPSLAPPFALALTFGCAALAIAPHHAARNLAARWMLTVFLWATFLVLRETLSLWPLLIELSVSASEVIGSIVGTSLRLGPSYSGMHLVIAFFLAMLAQMIVARRVHVVATIASCFLILLAASVAIALRTQVPTHHHGHAISTVYDWRLWAFVMMVLPFALFERLHPNPKEILVQQTRSRLLPFAAIVVLIAAGLSTWTAAIPFRTGRVLLDSRGEFSMQPIEWGKYGPMADTGANLSTLPQLLQAHGFVFETSEGSIDATSLRDTDVFMTMNPSTEYTEEEKQAIWDFVGNGGGLLVLGDHTNIKETMGPVNDLLEPTGIRLKFDSAIPLAERWSWYGSMRWHPHSVTRSVRDETDVKVSVGASLHVPASAVPVFSGRDAYSDLGDWNNASGAYLGNMAKDMSEELGDLFLAAEASYGRGKVIVFGDTSPFQRIAVFNTYELLANLFSYLSQERSSLPPRGLRIAAGIALLLGVVMWMSLWPRGLSYGTTVAALLSVWLLGIDRNGRSETPPVPEKAEIAWVDVAHANRIDTHAGVKHGMNGLTNHLWRQGYLPLAMKEFDADDLRASSAFVTVSPAIPFSGSQVSALEDFVEDGGLLIVATGFEEKNGAQPLLQAFGYDIAAVPIGAGHEAVSLLEGHSVLMHESWPVVRPDGRGEVWVECWGYPLIVHEDIGQGDLIVIGDSGFLWDAKMENSENFVEINIDFMRKAIALANGTDE